MLINTISKFLALCPDHTHLSKVIDSDTFYLVGISEFYIPRNSDSALLGVTEQQLNKYNLSFPKLLDIAKVIAGDGVYSNYSSELSFSIEERDPIYIWFRNLDNRLLYNLYKWRFLFTIIAYIEDANTSTEFTHTIPIRLDGSVIEYSPMKEIRRNYFLKVNINSTNHYWNDTLNQNACISKSQLQIKNSYDNVQRSAESQIRGNTSGTTIETDRTSGRQSKIAVQELSIGNANQGRRGNGQVRSGPLSNAFICRDSIKSKTGSGILQTGPQRTERGISRIILGRSDRTEVESYYLKGRVSDELFKCFNCGEISINIMRHNNQVQLGIYECGNPLCGCI